MALLFVYRLSVYWRKRLVYFCCFILFTGLVQNLMIMKESSLLIKYAKRRHDFDNRLKNRYELWCTQISGAASEA